MSRVKDPGEKKRISHEHDHRNSPWQGNKTFRNAWHKKKATINRQFRHIADAALTVILQTADIETDAAAMPSSKRVLQKTGVQSLAEAVADNLDKRVRRAARHQARRNKNSSS